jgi:hypothetical protein
MRGIGSGREDRCSAPIGFGEVDIYRLQLMVVIDKDEVMK